MKNSVRKNQSSLVKFQGTKAEVNAKGKLKAIKGGGNGYVVLVQT